MRMSRHVSRQSGRPPEGEKVRQIGLCPACPAEPAWASARTPRRAAGAVLGGWGAALLQGIKQTWHAAPMPSPAELRPGQARCCGYPRASLEQYRWSATSGGRRHSWRSGLLGLALDREEKEAESTGRVRSSYLHPAHPLRWVAGRRPEALSQASPPFQHAEGEVGCALLWRAEREVQY